MPGKLSRGAVACMLLALLACGAAEAQRVTFRLFDWLPGKDPGLHKQIREFFKVDPDKLPFMREVEGGFGIENPGGAPSAVAWTPIDLADAGLYTFRFEARWDGEGDHGRATAAFGAGRLDFEPRREWHAYGVTVRQAGPVGPSSISVSLRGRHGRLDVRAIDILKVPFDVRMRLQEGRPRLELLGRAAADTRLKWECGDRAGEAKLGDLKWNEEGGIAATVLDLAVSGVLRWSLVTAGGQLVAVGNPVRIGGLSAVPRGPSPYAVSIRDDGTVMVAGEPFFPVGLYLHESSVDAVDRAAESGINLALVSPSDDTRALVERARGRGMQAIVETSIAPDPAKVAETAKQLVDKYGSLPMLAWTAVDEPDLKPAYTTPVLDQIHRAIARLDGRPLYQANHSPGSFWTAGTAADILAVDPYPLGQIPKPITTVGQWIDEARAALGPGRSVWLIQQAFAEAPFWPAAPTPEQLRAMTWVGLNHGARGVMYYTVHEILDPASPPEYRWDLRRTPLWPEIARETKELKGLTPFLVSPGGPHTLPVAGSFDGAAWADGRGSVLVSVVNVAPTEAEALIPLPAAGLGNLRVWPDGPVVQPVGGRLGVRLPGYAVLLLLGKARQ